MSYFFSCSRMLLVKRSLLDYVGGKNDVLFDVVFLVEKVMFCFIQRNFSKILVFVQQYEYLFKNMRNFLKICVTFQKSA